MLQTTDEYVTQAFNRIFHAGLFLPPLYEYPLEMREKLVNKVLTEWKTGEYPLKLLKFATTVGVQMSFERMHRFIIANLILREFQDIIEKSLGEIDEPQPEDGQAITQEPT